MKKSSKNIVAGILIVVSLFLMYNVYIQSTSPLSQSFVSWTQNDNVIEGKAIVNQPVTLNIELKSKSLMGYQGNVFIDIRKDIALSGDVSVKKTTIAVDIPAGLYEKKSVKVTFIPDKSTDGIDILGVKTGVREYFYKITAPDNLVIYDPTESGERNGLLVSGTVIIAPPNTPTGSVSLMSVSWNAKANQASAATLKFRISGTYNQVVKIDIRKDVSLWLDEDIISMQATVSGTNTDVSVNVDFVAPNSGEYVFVRVPGIYDSTDRIARISQGTEIQVTSTGTGGGTTPQPTPGQTPGVTTTPTTVIPQLLTIESDSPKAPGGGGLRIDIPKGSNVDVYVYLGHGYHGLTGTLKVEVKRDLEWATDNVLTTLTENVEFYKTGVDADQVTTFMGSYQANDLTGSNDFRQYFYKVYWNNELIYDPTDPNSREAVYTH